MKRITYIVSILSLNVLATDGGIFIRGGGTMRMSGGAPGCAPVIYSSNGPVVIQTDGIDIDHGTIQGEGVYVRAQKFHDRAGKIRSSTTICIDAQNQKNETVINKWSRDNHNGRNYAHAEGISSIDECEFSAPVVIQKGKQIENIGVKVEADIYEDQGELTTNMPARITLDNYAHAEKRGWFSRASADYRRQDDVLVPSRFNVNSFRSLQNDGESAEVRFGYTMIKAGAEIEVTKDRKEDIPVQERHSIDVRQRKSGFSLFGGISVPNPTAQLQAMHRSSENANMVGLTTSTIGAVAQGINLYKSIDKIRDISSMSTCDMLSTLSQFVNGPSLQFGTREVSSRQCATITHGNFFEAPRMRFYNADKASFAGTYHAQDIDIRTKTLITFALPHELESSVSIHQTGVSLDLLSFALALMNPEVSCMTKALLGSSAVSISSQNTKTHLVENIPTKIIADRSLNITAENGYLIQAQIKAALVHAIFTNDCSLKTLTSDSYQKTNGIGVSTVLKTSFDAMATSLRSITDTMRFSRIDSDRFEKIIDEYASFVGTEEFYLHVGHILHERSAFFGHVQHDPNRERIEAGEIHHEEVEQVKYLHDRSFSISAQDIATVLENIKEHLVEDSVARGNSLETARQESEQKIEEIEEDVEEFQNEANKAVEAASATKSFRKERKIHSEKDNQNDVDDRVIDLLLNSEASDHKSLLEQEISECFQQVMWEQSELSPREQMMAFVPKNKAEEALKQATLLRYKLEDFVEKHPVAAEWCCKMFVGTMYALHGIEYGAAVVAGPFGIATKFAIREGSAFAIDKTVDESSIKVAEHITPSKILQQEFASTVKFCTYVGLCAGSVKAGKKLVSSLKQSALESAAFKRPMRLDIIKETEMIQKAAALPGEWKGQFKLINEIPQTKTGAEFASNIYCRQVLFKDPKTGQMFRVFQRNDIDPNYVITKGTTKDIGKTNVELMLTGKAPYTKSGEKVIIHHMGQNSFGPFVEVTPSYHKACFHNQFGINEPHPTNPVDRTEFDTIRKAYWRAYAKQFK